MIAQTRLELALDTLRGGSGGSDGTRTRTAGTNSAQPSSRDNGASDIPDSFCHASSSSNRRNVSESDVKDLAADLSHGLFGQLLGGKSLNGLGFEKLQLLTLAGSPLKTDRLEEVMRLSLGLVKLDASQCQLDSVPSFTAFAGLKSLLVLFLHKNRLQFWEDIERALKAPSLQWFTAFENPIASLLEFRGFVIRQSPGIRAVDNWVVADGERMGLTSSLGGRFANQSEESIVPIPTYSMVQSPHVLLREAQEELLALKRRRNRVSAVCCIQTFFRAQWTRRSIFQLRDKRLASILTIQRRARTYLWRKGMIRYLKDYLAEINELDFLLSAQEMLRLRAAKRIETAVRSWIGRRSRLKMQRKAAESVNRMTRGFIARRQVLREHLEIQKYRKIYFPAEYAWEFLVMLNITRKQNNLEPLPRTHKFKPAEVIGIRIPDTDEVPQRQASLVNIVQFSQHCLLRPRRFNRYPDHLWDGPFHRLVDECAPSPILRAYQQVKRRGANVDNRCRKIFLKSCAPPESHPIDELPEADVSNGEESVSLVVKSILEGPETEWPKEARQHGTPLNQFMREAKQVGSRPRRSKFPRGISGHNGAERDQETGLPCYRHTTWLNQRMMYHECQSEKVVVDMLTLLVRLSRSSARMPLVKPVPFLTEKVVVRIAAVTVIQATYRAHRVRCGLSCALRTALVIRRAVLCIQRNWRWGLMKRRLEFLVGAVKYVQAVKSSSLYLEERLFTALNVISSIDRYPPTLQERALGLGYVDDETNGGNLVIVRGDMRGVAKLKGTSAKDAFRKRALRREGGLPSWFMSRVGSPQAVGPDDPSLRRVVGVQGLLLEEVGERFEEHIETVTMASIKHAAKLASDSQDHTTPALVACAGTFRFVEMRFQSAAQARQRALLVYFATFNAQHHCVVPLLSKSMLHDSSICKNILQLWELYGLTWQAGDRAAPYQLKLRGAKMQTEVIPLCGNQPMRLAIQGEWKNVDEQATRSVGWAQKREKNKEATYQKYSAFAKQYSEKRNREFEDQHQRLRETSIDRLYEDQAPGTVEVCVTGALPPATSERLQEAPAAIMHAEKIAAKSLIAAGKELEAERVRNLHDSVVDGRGKVGDALGFEDTIRAFHEERHPLEKVRKRQREEEKKMQEERTKELAKIHALELAHKKAENHIIQRSQLLEKVHEVRTKVKVDDQKKLKVEEAERIREEHRAKKEEDKARKAKRNEAKRAMNEFMSQRFWMENACGKYDAAHRQEEELTNAQAELQKRQRNWAHRTAALAERQQVTEDFTRTQTNALRDQLSNDLAAKGQADEENLIKLRWHLAQRKTIAGLMKAAKGEIKQLSRDVTENSNIGAQETGLQASYRRVLEAFRNIADLEAKPERSENKQEFDGEACHMAWLSKGWLCKDSDASDASSDTSFINIDDIPQMPDDLKKKLAQMAHRHSVHWRSLASKPSEDSLVTLVPRRPAVERPKTLPQLSRRTAAGTTTSCDQKACESSGAVFNPENRHSFLPKLREYRRPGEHMRLPSKSIDISDTGEKENAVSGTGRTAALLAPDANEEPRTLASMKSSKKNHSEGTLSNITTAVGSSATDSATTLLSSQKSLPPVPPILAPPPVPICPAFRGNPVPPRMLSSSIMLPSEQAPANRRPLRAPYTVR